MNDETTTPTGDPTTNGPEHVACPNCGGPAPVLGIITRYQIDEHGVREIGRIIEHNGTFTAYSEESNGVDR